MSGSFGWICAVLVALSGCGGGVSSQRTQTRQEPSRRADLRARQAPAPRRVDPSPVTETSADPLPAGTATFEFFVDTSGDQMRPMQAGLGFAIRYESVHIHQVVASCDAAGFGEPPPENGRAVADCDGETVEAIIEPGAIRVQRAGRVLSVVSLPRNVRFGF